MLHYFLYLLKLPSVLTDVHMALNWGIPNIITECQNSSLMWKHCYQKCYEDENCVLAIWNNSNCANCDANSVTFINKSDYLNGYHVAIKFNLTGDQCPATFASDQVASGIVSDRLNSSVTYPYEVLESFNGWTLNYTSVITRCEKGWEFFERMKGGWCIKVVQSLNISYVDAQKQCGEQGGILTGMENSNETDYIAEMGTGFNITLSNQFVFVDGIRKSICNTNATLYLCDRSFDSFNFNDTFATGQAGYVSAYPGSFPDGAMRADGPESCLGLYTAELKGYTDDKQCASRSPTIGYACGKVSNY